MLRLHVLVGASVWQCEISGVAVDRMNMQSILFRPTAQFPEEIAELLLIGDVQIVLLPKENYTSLRDNNSKVANLLLIIGSVQDVGNLYGRVFASDYGCNLEEWKVVKGTRIFKRCRA